ncbi:PREDICTED: putative clathrin assembly protein At1g25240 [Nelumbo nucifera]|uniref:Clathrin assembly protein At1g25240 n=2 Tax=Nelumbo nucifera TaxID=4432 RepID=A0A1U8B4R6_NELNU|nr:PREDICTED: putative clathrin assembly protein At1g25240 [Nelumbo nucifera]DAD32366.1 TPA_asm: hypothetical protein HUJ06_011217 [Nelumbo nucifera]
MKVWKKASAVWKDNNSIYLAKLARKKASRNPELEEAIIKATSHDEFSLDYKNAQRVFSWIRTSPASLRPFLRALSARMDKTQSWVVALKGLMLLHGVFCCKIPAVQKIGRLPFDFSNFSDGHSSTVKTWGFNVFVRVYFVYLDQRSVILSRDFVEKRGSKEKDESMMKLLLELQQLQALLDLLLQIRPHADGMNVKLIFEAMDCVVIEIFEIYDRIYNGIAKLLMGIFSAGKKEAAKALTVLQKAAIQGEQLSSYFDFCKRFGVLNASECPKVLHIPEEGIRDLERIINGVPLQKKSDVSETDKAKVVVETKYVEVELQKEPENLQKTTLVTDNWVVFDDQVNNNKGEISECNVETTNFKDPFAASLKFPPLVQNPANSPAISRDLILL